MLQIIGLLGCFYLFIKGMELWAQRGTEEAANRVFSVGAQLAWIGSIVFAGLLILQADGFSNLSADIGGLGDPTLSDDSGLGENITDEYDNALANLN